MRLNQLKIKRVALCWYVHAGTVRCDAWALTHDGLAMITVGDRKERADLAGMKRRALQAFRRQGVGVTLYCRPDVKAQAAVRGLGGVWGEVSKRTGGVVRMRDVVLPAGVRLPDWAKEVVE